MSYTVPNQHPAVVLRSTYVQLRALLAIALIVIVGLTIAVIALANNSSTTTSPVTHGSSTAISVPSISQTDRTSTYGGHY